MQSESNFEKKCIRELRLLPMSYWPDKPDAGSIRGTPDRVGCVNTVYCALEFKKSESEALKKTGRIVLQKFVLGEIESAGGFSALVWPSNWELVYDELITYCGLKGM